MDDRGSRGFWVGDWLVEPALNRIKRGDHQEHLEPRSMAVLEHLVAHRGEVLSKQQLIDGVWGDVFVGDEVLSHAIWDLRRSLGDDARSPKYIQTITKRGYRLIAEVRPAVEPSETTPHESGRAARVVAGVALVTAVALALWLFAAAGRDPVPGSTAGPETRLPRLEVAVDGESDEASRRVLEAIRADLSAISSFEVVEGAPPRSYPYSARDHGLKLQRTAHREPGLAVVRLHSLTTGATVWTGTVTYGGSSSLSSGESSAVSVVDRIRIFGEINAHDLYHDPHLEPWIDLRRHDWRAVLHFLRDAQRTYDFEVGDGTDYLAAMTLDEGFLAPLVWGWGACERQFGAECRARLERLRDGDYNFDSAVAQFRLHALDRDLLMARRSLRDALDIAPGNGPIRVNLAHVERFLGDDGARRALAALTPLVEEGWRYPSVYPQAASYALELGDFERAREILLRGVEFRPDVIDTLVLLEALALLEGDTELAEGCRRRYLDRIQVLTPAEKAPLVHSGYRAILERALSTGDTEVAGTLRNRLDELTEKTG